MKIIELAGIGPCPLAGMMLADMGAEVILVERKHANPNAAAPMPDQDARKKAFYNRGKKSVAVNLKQEGAVELVLGLVEGADVLMEGFRPGVMERLGLGPDVCAERNPRLIYGRMTGWGQSGPLAQAAGHDPNYAAVSGALWYGGRPGHPPTAPLTMLGDVGGGTMILLFGILAALHHARTTGQGQVIDAAMTDGSAYTSSLLWVMQGSGMAGSAPGSSWVNGAAPWNDSYECSDGGFVTVCAIEPAFYRELVERLDLCGNPLFADQWDQACWPEARNVVRELFLSRTRDEWCSDLEGTDACFGPVLDFSEAPEHPHNRERQTFVERGGITQPAPAPRLAGTPGEIGEICGVGEHTREVLEAAGFGAAQIAEFERSELI